MNETMVVLTNLPDRGTAESSHASCERSSPRASSASGVHFGLSLEGAVENARKCGADQDPGGAYRSSRRRSRVHPYGCRKSARFVVRGLAEYDWSAARPPFRRLMRFIPLLLLVLSSFARAVAEPDLLEREGVPLRRAVKARARSR